MAVVNLHLGCPPVGTQFFDYSPYQLLEPAYTFHEKLIKIQTNN